MSDNKLILSDLQIPFEHQDALAFCIAVKEKFNIQDKNIYNVGDEVDCAGINDYGIDPDGLSPGKELILSREKIKDWAKAFPLMKICESNHPARIYKRAFNAGLPKAMIKELGEIYSAPKTWKWQERWLVDGIIIEHGHHFGGMKPNTDKVILANMRSTIVGHYHNDFKIEWVNLRGKHFFFAVAGSLIDNDTYAFNYNKRNIKQPVLGVIVIINKEPRLVRMELNKHKRWDGNVK